MFLLLEEKKKKGKRNKTKQTKTKVIEGSKRRGKVFVRTVQIFWVPAEAVQQCALVGIVDALVAQPAEAAADASPPSHIFKQATDSLPFWSDLLCILLKRGCTHCAIPLVRGQACRRNCKRQHRMWSEIVQTVAPRKQYCAGDYHYLVVCCIGSYTVQPPAGLHNTSAFCKLS